ncbi:hypothetical protein [Sulfurimonas paralvinellae]|uniref:Uncharacterized protein n=1 Tax=Sulfurimonas paralvinellae TaxID=317658 RepID=A0A7M1B6L3_9BACT|nr:hypothetical protein [Sulfurimonas paralvinellae]QOP45379.1 hypothetical protein FM071_03440 [Sulfurimonas paralvinellae]
MDRFFELEIPYIVIMLFFLAVTAFVTTRDFMPKGAFKKGMIGIFGVFAIMIGLHYYVTSKRMDGVKEIFNNGETIICENKMRRTISQSVLISKKLGWRLEGDYFKNPDFERDFHTARCVDYAPIAAKAKEDTQK